jgi:hypothetical protein
MPGSPTTRSLCCWGRVKAPRRKRGVNVPNQSSPEGRHGSFYPA